MIGQFSSIISSPLPNRNPKLPGRDPNSHGMNSKLLERDKVIKIPPTEPLNHSNKEELDQNLG